MLCLVFAVLGNLICLPMATARHMTASPGSQNIKRDALNIKFSKMGPNIEVADKSSLDLITESAGPVCFTSAAKGVLQLCTADDYQKLKGDEVRFLS